MTARAFLLTGEPFLADEALQRVRAETGADPLAEVSFDGRPPVSELVGALDTPSLLGGVRLVIVRNGQELLKEHVEAIQRYLEQPSPSSVLVVIAAGRTKLDAAIKKAGTAISLEAPRGRRLMSWARERARQHSLTLDDRAAWSLLDAVGTELRDIDGALAQLATALGAGARATPADVKQMFPRTAEQRIYTFTDAVGDRKIGPAMASLRRLLEQGDEPLVIFGALAAQMRRMLRARAAADGGTSAVAEVVGLPEWRAKRLTAQARSYRPDELVAAMQILAETDVEMKGGDLPPAAALERTVVKIVTGI